MNASRANIGLHDSVLPAESHGALQLWTDRLLKSLSLGNGWRGNLFNLHEDRVDITSREVRSRIANRVAATASPDLAGEVSSMQEAADVVRCFLPSKGVVSSVDENGFVDLLTLAIRSCSNADVLGDLELRIGFGAANVQSTRARVPAYILTAKRILESLLADQVRRSDEATSQFPRKLPRVRIYSADAFVARANGEDASSLSRSTERNFSLINAYLQQFSSSRVAERFTFDRDRSVEQGSVLDAQIGYFSQVLQRTADLSVRSALKQVFSNGAKHGSSMELSARYGAAHTLYSADCINAPFIPILRDATEFPSALIMIGGPPERTYWKLRKGLEVEANVSDGIAYFRDQLSAISSPGCTETLRLYEHFTTSFSASPRAQLITRSGEWPVYGHYLDDWTVRNVAERSFDRLLSDSYFNLAMKRDLLAILCDIAGLPLETAYLWTFQKNFGSSERDALERAYLRLRDFYKDFLQCEQQAVDSFGSQST
jgi:hypothetical protein